MKALTIWQPWATLIMAGAKPWEWRGWRAPSAVVGQRIVIHAGARMPRASEIADILARIDDDESSLDPAIAIPLLRDTPMLSWPLAAGLGTAVLERSIPAIVWANKHCKPGFDSDRLDHSKFAWPLTEIERWESVRPARGHQGFWIW